MVSLLQSVAYFGRPEGYGRSPLENQWHLAAICVGGMMLSSQRSNISNMRRCISSDIQTLRSGFFL